MSTQGSRQHTRRRDRKGALGPEGFCDGLWRPRGYLLLGEFGIQSQTSHGGKSLVWIQRLMAYMGSTMSWTFWTINPNSGDTGGILQDNWVSVNQWKMDILSPYLAPQFPAP